MGKFLDKYKDSKEKKSVKEVLLTPISKQLTGKSLSERADLLNKQGEAIANQRGMSGKPLSTFEAFMLQLPAATGQAAVQMADVSPADLALMAATAGAAKIPIAGTTLGQIASKAPVGKGFVQGVKELGAASKAAPVASLVDDVVTKPKPINTPQEFAENINLTKFPEDVRGYVKEVIAAKPEIGKTPTISDESLFTMAKELKDTPTVKYLTGLPEGTVESEALKVRLGNTETIREILKAPLSNLKEGLNAVVEDGLARQRKMASIFGRGLRQQKLPAETQQEMAFLVDETIKQISRDPILKNDKDLIGSVTKLRDTIIDKDFNPTLLNKVYYTWLNSILSNPFTHLVNTTSNTLFAMSKIPEKFASALWDIPISTFTGKRTHSMGEIPAMVRGLLSKERLPQDVAQMTKLDVYAKPIKGMAGKIIGAPTELLKIEDDIAKTVVGRMETYAQRYMGKTGEALTSAVKDEQLYRTFQNEPGEIAKWLMEGRNRIPGLRYVIPFLKTPANLIARSLERTPLYAGKMVQKAVSKQYTQAELSKDLGLLSLGSTLAAWIAWQKVKGNITGNAPDKPAERDAFYRQGKKPNAIKLGEYWVPLERLDPFGGSFSIISNLIDGYQNSEKDIPAEKISDAVGTLSKTLVNKTYLSGLANLIKATSDPEMYGAGWMRRIASGVIPNFFGFLAQLKDPYYREADTILDILKSKTPGLSETLPPKLNALGQAVRREALNIGRHNMSALEGLLSETPIGFPSKTLGKTKLTPDEYRALVKDAGDIIKPSLELLAGDERFLALPVEQRAKEIDDIVSNARRIARKRIAERRAQGKDASIRAQFNSFIEQQGKPFGQSSFMKKYGKKGSGK